jgi:phosphatidate cytidylyltransferase
MMSRNLALRIAFAVPAIAVTVAAVWLGGWVLAGLLAFVGVLGAREVYDLARRQEIQPLYGIGYGAAAAIPFGAIWAQQTGLLWAEPLLFLSSLWLLLVMVAAMAVRGPGGRPLAGISVTIFGALYASALLAFIVPIRHGAHSDAHPLASTALVLLPLVVTWVGDTCAMVVGVSVGGPKLAPILSPHKTWSGAVGGLIGAVVTAVGYGRFVLDRVALHLDLSQLLALGTLIAVVGQVGDIAESLLKREAGLKDSSGIIPGHGGVLDRMDSLYFVLPASATLLRLFGVI